MLLGGTLDVAAQCTKSGVVKKVYKGYIAIGKAPFWFMQHLKFTISSPIYWDSGNLGYNGYYTWQPRANCSAHTNSVNCSLFTFQSTMTSWYY